MNKLVGDVMRGDVGGQVFDVPYLQFVEARLISWRTLARREYNPRFYRLRAGCFIS